MQKFIVLVAFIFVQVSAAGADVTIDLPELAGGYSIGSNPPAESPWTRTMTFTLPDSIQSLDGLRFLVSGPWTNGQLEICRSIGGLTVCDTVPTYTNLTLHLTADALGVCHFSATVSAFNWVSGDELLIEVCTEGQSDVNLLLGTVVSAELFCDVAPEIRPNLVEAAFGNLNEVSLETVGAIRTKKTAWGAVKSLYR